VLNSNNRRTTRRSATIHERDQPTTRSSAVAERPRSVSVVETMKRSLGITQGHWKRYHSKARVRFPISIPYQWPHLQPFRHNTRTWQTPMRIISMSQCSSTDGATAVNPRTNTQRHYEVFGVW